MIEVSTKDLKDQLSEWIRRVEQSGEPVVVTRSGRPVAALVALADLPVREPASVLVELANAGAVRLPRTRRRKGAFLGDPVPARGVSATAMVLEDRR